MIGTSRLGNSGMSLNSESAFRNEPNPIAVFGIMPVFWKIWLLVILAAMIGAFIYVAQTTVRVG